MASSKVLAFLSVLVVVVPSSAFGRIFDCLAAALAPFYGPFDFSTSDPALPPLPEIPISVNLPDFNLCYFTKCRARTCTNTPSYEHICECNPRYNNLFSASSFACYSENSLGSDTGTFGLEVSNAEVDANGVKQGTSFLPGMFHWMTIFVTSVAMALWK